MNESKNDSLFSISTDPVDQDAEPPRTLLYDKDVTFNDDEEAETGKRLCFNCGATDHSVRECQKQFDPEAVTRNRMAFQRKGPPRFSGEFKRYHVEIEDANRIESSVRPGVISDQLREALGISKLQIPEYVYRMRVLGYPPGWLEEATERHSGINMIDSYGKRVPDPDEEEGEIYSSRKRYNLDKIIDYPGYNVWPPFDALNETEFYGAPNMAFEHSKVCFVAALKEAMEKDEEAALEELRNDSPCPTETTLRTEKLIQNGPENSPTVTEHLQVVSPNAPDENPISDDSNSSFGKTKSVHLGTPALKIHSPFTQLPPAEAFRKDMDEVLFFENLPNSTGSYEKLKGVLQGVRSKMALFKETESGTGSK